MKHLNNIFTIREFHEFSQIISTNKLLRNLPNRRLIAWIVKELPSISSPHDTPKNVFYIFNILKV